MTARPVIDYQLRGKKKKRILSFALASALLPLCAVAQVSVTGQACLGADHNTLVEELSNVCKQATQLQLNTRPTSATFITRSLLTLQIRLFVFIAAMLPKSA